MDGRLRVRVNDQYLGGEEVEIDADLVVVALAFPAAAQDGGGATGGQPWDLRDTTQPGLFVFYDTPTGASTTGKPLMRWVTMRCAASDRGVCGRTLRTGWLMIWDTWMASEARRLANCSARWLKVIRSSTVMSI